MSDYVEEKIARLPRELSASQRLHPPRGRGRVNDEIPDTVYKVVEVVGTSEHSASKAIESAIAKASTSLRHLGWFEVAQIRGSIRDGKVSRYQATLKVGFTLE